MLSAFLFLSFGRELANFIDVAGSGNTRESGAAMIQSFRLLKLICSQLELESEKMHLRNI